MMIYCQILWNHILSFLAQNYDKNVIVSLYLLSEKKANKNLKKIKL